MDNKCKHNHGYRFLRWFILSLLRFPKLYILVWGILLGVTLIFLKGDILVFFERIFL